jgi:hypothetical protein
LRYPGGIGLMPLMATDLGKGWLAMRLDAGKLLGGAGLALLLSGAAARAEDPTGFTCTFRAGTTLTYNKAKSSFRKVGAKPLTFEVGAIDMVGQKAELTTSGSKGKGPLRIVRALNANHFLEVVGEGFLNITTVFDRDPKLGAHPAVHSRHFGLFGEPVVAQYHGNCKAK